MLEECGVVQPALEALLGTAGVFRQLDGDLWVRWDGSISDKAERVLRLTCTPLSVEELNVHIGEGHSTGTLRNALNIDPRFVRLDKAGRFGLASWGLEEYSGIAQEIIERIERGGGSADVEEIVDEFVAGFGVSEASVRWYASSPAFVVEGGQVRLRTKDEPYEPDLRVARVRGLYAPPGGVIVHFTTDKDILRGSGRGLWEPAAALLGVLPGGRREFACDTGGRVVVSWPATSTMGPSIGSIRSLAFALGLQEGEPLRVVFDSATSRCRAERVTPTSLEGLTGLQLGTGAETAGLANAIRVEEIELRSALQARGDLAVLELLPPADVSEDLTSAISEFGDLLG